jgi:hypothetical protein
MTLRARWILWGAIALCAPSVSCSLGGSLNPFKASRTEPMVEGTSIGPLRIGEATMVEATKAFPTDRAPRAVGDGGLVQLSTPMFELSFVPPPDGQGQRTLYAARAPLKEDGYLGKTSKGIGFLDSVDAMRAAYGPPDAEVIGLFDNTYYYQQGVIFTARHPKEIQPPALYAQVRAELGTQPSEAPDAQVITGIMVVRPFTILEAPTTVTSHQRVLSIQPKTDLLVSPF